MNGYAIVDQRKIEDHITFLRIDPVDIAITLREILDSLSDLSWIGKFDDDYLKTGFRVRAQDSIKYISQNIIKSTDTDVTAGSGEYVVSELARRAVVDTLKYLDIPLAELIKVKDIGNHGFDFYSKNHDTILLFGEAKYSSTRNAYGSSFEQIARFESHKQDCSDVIDIDRFCCDESKKKFAAGQKGFIAAFASKKTPTDKLISGIENNSDYKKISVFDELICIAVNI